MTATMAPRSRGLRDLAFLVAALACSCSTALALVPNQAPVRLDCGSTAGSTDAQGLVWGADTFFGANASAQTIPPQYTDGGSLSAVDTTVRFWQTGDSCYRVPVAKGRYLVRLSFTYNNYDGNFFTLFPRNQLPLVGVTINDYLVEEVGTTGYNNSGYYTDYIAFSAPFQKDSGFPYVDAEDQGEAITVCLAAVQGVPYINSLQVLPVDTESYFTSATGSNVVLSTWRRFHSGSASVLGPETNGDLGYRTWSPDAASAPEDPWEAISTASSITIPDAYASLNLPQALFQTARKAGARFNSTGYNFTGIHPVDANNKFLVVLYFAEIEEGVTMGQRVMDVWVNGQSLQVDVVKAAGAASTALVVNLVVPLGGDPKSVFGQWLAVLLRPSAPSMLRPLISGVEVFEIIASPHSLAPAAPPSANTPTEVRIDCGGQFNYTDPFSGFLWHSDYGFSSGYPSIVTKSGNNYPYSSSLRYFPYPAQNCYNVPVPNGRYQIRLFFDYGNYDLKDQVPTFQIAVESTVVVAIIPYTPGGFQDMLATVSDGAATICLLGEAQIPYPTFINSVEVLEVNTTSYRPDLTGENVVLYNYYRVASGSIESFGEGFSAGVERGHRQWFSGIAIPGMNYSCVPDCSLDTLPSTPPIKGADVAPNFIPAELFKNALTATQSISYTFSALDDAASLLLVLYFAETATGARAGARVFSVLVDGKPVTGMENIDLVEQPGLNTMLMETYAFQLASKKRNFTVTLQAAAGSTLGPVISGLELYRIIPEASQSSPALVESMYSLRDNMLVPEAASWQGDPCSPVAWTGVQCNAPYTTADGKTSGFQITSINLSGLGANGSIPDAISKLTDLTSLNLSRNALIEGIPANLTALTKLVTLDLSSNQLNGSIPAGLSSMPSLHQLLLNNNLLMGVPSGLVPPPNGLTVDLGNNPYLCGADGFPSCNSIVFPPPPGGNYTALDLGSSSSGSSSSGLSAGAIIGIVLGVLALLSVLGAGWVLWRRRRRVSFETGTPRKITVFEPRNPYAKTTLGGAFDVVPEEEFEGESSSGRHEPFRNL